MKDGVDRFAIAALILMAFFAAGMLGTGIRHAAERAEMEQSR